MNTPVLLVKRPDFSVELYGEDVYAAEATIPDTHPGPNEILAEQIARESLSPRFAKLWRPGNLQMITLAWPTTVVELQERQNDLAMLATLNQIQRQTEGVTRGKR